MTAPTPAGENGPRWPIPSTPDQREEAIQRFQRGQKGRDLLAQAIGLLNIDRYDVAYHDAGDKVIVRIPVTDAFLLAARIATASAAERAFGHAEAERIRAARATEPPEVAGHPAGEGEPAHYERIDAGPVVGSDWTRRGPSGPEGEAYRRGW